MPHQISKQTFLHYSSVSVTTLCIYFSELIATSQSPVIGENVATAPAPNNALPENIPGSHRIANKQSEKFKIDANVVASEGDGSVRMQLLVTACQGCNVAV